MALIFQESKRFYTVIKLSAHEMFEKETSLQILQ